jgi:hypothetical protein
MGRFACPRVIVSGWFDYEVHHLGSVHYTKRRRERINSFNIHSLSIQGSLSVSYLTIWLLTRRVCGQCLSADMVNWPGENGRTSGRMETKLDETVYCDTDISRSEGRILGIGNRPPNIRQMH